MQGLKSDILAFFKNGLRWLCPVSPALNNPSQELINSCCFGWHLSLERLEAKTRKIHFLRFISDLVQSQQIQLNKILCSTMKKWQPFLCLVYVVHSPSKCLVRFGLYGVKWPQQKQACHSHDDAKPLSFQLQVTEDFL